MKTNSPSERLVNGILKENPTFVLMLGYVSDIGSYNLRDQRYRNGIDDDGNLSGL